MTGHAFIEETPDRLIQEEQQEGEQQEEQAEPWQQGLQPWRDLKKRRHRTEEPPMLQSPKSAIRTVDMCSKACRIV